MEIPSKTGPCRDIWHSSSWFPVNLLQLCEATPREVGALSPRCPKPWCWALQRRGKRFGHKHSDSDSGLAVASVQSQITTDMPHAIGKKTEHETWSIWPSHDIMTVFCCAQQLLVQCGAGKRYGFTDWAIAAAVTGGVTEFPSHSVSAQRKLLYSVRTLVRCNASALSERTIWKIGFMVRVTWKAYDQ